MLRTILCLFSFSLILISCTQAGRQRPGETYIPDSAELRAPAEAAEVIYALSLPVDITGLFEQTGTGFQPELLMPLDRIPLYDRPGQMALLLGSLGVDLSYCKLFERSAEAADCYRHIELLAGRLDLPEDIFDISGVDLEYYVEDPDSLTILIERIYNDADRHFRATGNESLASLALLGGWLQTMYIGVHLYRDHRVLEMSDRILQQKYALNSLAGLLSNYQESLVVRRYMHSLNRLRLLYKGVEIRYPSKGFQMKPSERIFLVSGAEIDAKPEQLEQICDEILRTRQGMIP